MNIFQTENSNNYEFDANKLEISKKIRKFRKNLRIYLKNEQTYEIFQKEKYFEESFKENKEISEQLQQLEIKKSPEIDKIIDKFLQSQKIFEKVYEDFLLSCQKAVESNQDDLFHIIQEIQLLKQSDTFNLEISLFKRILKAIENGLNNMENNKNCQALQQIKMLISEANNLETNAFAFEVSELGVLRDTNRKKEEIIEQISQNLNEKDNIIEKIQKENEEFKVEIFENNKKYERLLSENQQLLKENSILKLESAENKENLFNLENKSMKNQKNIDEEKNRKIMKIKEKNQEFKRVIKNLEEELLIKNEENKRLHKEKRELKNNSDEEIKMLKEIKTACQEEKF